MTPGYGRSNLARIWHFLVSDVWDVDVTSLSALRRFGVAAVRVCHLVVKGFREDECQLHASALTFSTLMAIVPVLALSLALARVFGGDALAREKVQGLVSEWTARFEQPAAPAPAVAAEPEKHGWFGRNRTDESAKPAISAAAAPKEPSNPMARQINRMVDSAFARVEGISFAALGGVGLVVLLWSVVQVLGTVEGSFNRVWGVTSGRSLWRRITDYLSAVLILPFLAIAASSLPIVDYVTQHVDPSWEEQVRSVLLSGTLRNLTVLLMTSVTFAFVIMFMPNMRVRLGPGVAGGVTAALLFLGWLWVCASFQVWVAGYGRIYGSFALVPIILAWVYVSWEIVLFGAETAFSIQNWDTYRMEQGARRASVQAKLILALSIVVDAARAMLGAGGALDLAAYARDRRVPVRLLNEVVDELSRCGLAAELADRPGCLALLKAPTSLTVRDVFDAMVQLGVAPEQLGLLGIDDRVAKAVRRVAGEGSGLERLRVADLVA